MPLILCNRRSDFGAGAIRTVAYVNALVTLTRQGDRGAHFKECFIPPQTPRTPKKFAQHPRSGPIHLEVPPGDFFDPDNVRALQLLHRYQWTD
jgi:hypothetical protein